ncbi:MAG TPA: hypothetical protein VIW21_00905 [Chthoniobacterales bacterium]
MELPHVIAALSWIALSAQAAGDVELGKGCTAHFASVAEATAILGQKDDFIQRLSPFDRAARMKTDKSVSEEEFLRFVKTNAAAWSESEQAKVGAAISALRPALESLPIAFPKKISFIKTTGAEEGGAFYTRDSAVMMPAKQTDAADGELLKKTIAHELFHILSRTNPELREKLYALIGFTNCGEIEFPDELKARKITNPDAPRNDHAIRVRANGREVNVVPILFSSAPNYDLVRDGEFFNYLQLGFVIVSKNPNDGADVLPPQQLSGFFEQVGRNTNYIIHPEEILAENFALLTIGRRDVPSPDLLDRLRQALGQK